MSLDILKERFSGKPITSQYEDKIQDKEKIIEKLESEAQNLSNQVLNLEKEKNFLVQELNKSKQFEDGTFSIKEKDYINQLQSKENIIKEVKQKTDLLYEELNKKDERLSYKNNIIKNSLNIIKETKTKINYLNVKLQNSKNSKKELQLEIKKTYQDYIFKMNNLENDIKDRNDIINEHKQVLTENNKKLKDLSSTIQELKITNTKDKQKINELNTKLEESKNFLILENDTFKKKLNKKENYISELKGKVENLSEKVSSLSETANEKTILEKKLYDSENFKNIIKETTTKKIKKELEEKQKDKINTFKKNINELNLKIDNNKNEYTSNLTNYESMIISRDETINSLKQSLEELKKVNNETNLAEYESKINEKNKKQLKEKEEYISKLKEKINSLSKEMKNLSQQNIELSESMRDKKELQNRLKNTENFESLINDKQDDFAKFIKETSDLRTFNLVKLLTSISKEKQGDKKLNWEEWLEIPENKYLNELNHNIAKKVFNENQILIDEARISNKTNLLIEKRYNHKGDVSDFRLEPLKISGLLYYGNNENVVASSVNDSDWGTQEEVTQITDLSGKNNHLVVQGSTHDGDTSELTNGTTNVGNPHIDTGSYGIRFGYRDPQDSPSRADRMSFKNTLLLDGFTAFYVFQQQDNAGDDEDGETELSMLAQAIDNSTSNENSIQFRGNYSSDGANLVSMKGKDDSDNDSAQNLQCTSDVEYNTKFLLTITKASYADGGLVTAYINHTNVGTNDGFTKDVDVKINMIGDDSYGADAFDLFEMAYYERELDSGEIEKLQNYFIDRQNLVDNFQ